ncbi:MAG TPA: di-heme oxidoredictase family protein [Gemmatimonadales bacterium]|nr:di-heme oxidoredictase family protein [Gemmatimonadales bacterium]
MSRTLVVVAVLGLMACTDRNDVSEPASDPIPATDDVSPLELSASSVPSDAHTALSGGATTVYDISIDAFSLPAPNLSSRSLARHDVGDEDFEEAFVPAPALENGGLGPVFDNVSCESCHLGDGRGTPPNRGEEISSLLFRASVSGTGAHGGPAPVPGFGGQLQLRAVPGFVAEVSAAIRYAETRGTFSDGTRFQLRAPQYDIAGLAGPLPAGVLVSPRVAPVVFGLGLLEAVPEADVLALADPKDRNRDGISGRANYVWDEARGRTALGRFGWKANAPNLVQQTAGAYNGDMGITSSLFPAESCEGYDPRCGRHAPEVDDATVRAVAFYTQTLGVPARRNLDDPKASAGEQLFHAVGCASCHVATLRTGSLKGVSEVSGQVIHPYSDLLVHDMGPGLADDRPDFQASGREWRTPPLWGIGLVQTVNGHTNFLHDGRARSLMEAVLWHGGEAQAARDRVRGFSADERAALVTFLESL